MGYVWEGVRSMMLGQCVRRVCVPDSCAQIQSTWSSRGEGEGEGRGGARGGGAIQRTHLRCDGAAHPFDPVQRGAIEGAKANHEQ